MNHGMSDEAMQHRRNLLVEYCERMQTQLLQVPSADPAGLLLDLEDFLAIEYYYAVEQSLLGRSEADCDAALIQLPDESCYFYSMDLDTLRRLVEQIQTNKDMLEQCVARRKPGYHIVMVVARKGNTYCPIYLPRARDGQNRTRSPMFD